MCVWMLVCSAQRTTLDAVLSDVNSSFEMECVVNLQLIGQPVSLMDLPVSASQVLRLEVCANMCDSFLCVLRIPPMSSCFHGSALPTEPGFPSP